MLRIPYGKDLVGDIRLLDPATGEFMASAPTIAAGDLTVHHDRLAPANPTSKTVTFTSGGTAELRPGETVTGATSAATAVVMGIRLTSGTWAGGDAAGELFVRSDSGTFQAENLNGSLSGANVCTIDAALDAAGLFRYLVGKRFAFGIPGTQLTGARGTIDLIDATATEEWEDTSVPFETFDHPLAADPDGCLYSGTATSVTASTLVGENLDDGIVRPTSANASIGPSLVIYVESATTGAGQAVPVSSYTHASRTFTLLYNWPLTPTGTIVYKIYSIARMPAHVMALAASVIGAASFATSSLPGQGAPTATPTMDEAIMYLYKAWRNRHTQSSSEYALYADDTTTKDQEAVVSDNGTIVDRGEVGTGA